MIRTTDSNFALSHYGAPDLQEGSTFFIHDVTIDIHQRCISYRGVKRRDGDEEGIYLLAKDLAYYVALDQTTKLSEGIQKLTHKGLYDVKEVVKGLDPAGTSDSAIVKMICKDAYETTASGSSNLAEHTGKCGEASSTKNNNAVTGGWENLWNSLGSDTNTSPSAGNYNKSDTVKKVGDKTSVKISEDIRGLTKEQHGVVSSAFAKAHEGAEIVAK